MASDHANLRKFNELVNFKSVTTVLHNALFDTRVLADMGIRPRKIHDTMVMAYLLQDLPLGLKPLSYRLLDLTMRKYTDVIHEAQQYKSLEYLLHAQGLQWSDPDQVLVWAQGYPKIKRPQNISRKIAKLLKAYSNDPAVDLAAKWKAIDYDGGRGQVQDVLGPMPQASLADVDFSEALQYACADAVATYKIYPILLDRITELGLWDTFERDMGIQPIVSDMMSTGIRINKQHFHDLDQTLEIEKSNVESEINSIYPGEENLNPGSTQQVAKALYKMRILPNPTSSTDAKTLDKYKDKHPIVNLIARWREIAKLQSTYLRPLPLNADCDDRIHTKLSNTNTTTGRLASSKPNLQNIPARTKEGLQIRHGFIASPGCSLVSLDYSQIEMRCVAHMSEDPTMIRMFMEDLDIHSETAAKMFKIPLDQVDKIRHRRPAKSIGFGVIYGMGPYKLQEQMLAEGIKYTEQECKELIDMWFGVYPGIYAYMDQIKADARRLGLVRDYFGRYRLIPETISTVPRIVHAGLRQAGNFPIQSMAQQIIKQAMVELVPVYRDLQEGGLWRCDPVLQIHDELVWEISDEIIETAVPVIKSIMESAVELVVPTPVDSNIGQTWGELK